MVFTTSMGMHEFDMIIVGTGSGNSIPGPEFDDWKIAIVEKGVFGGTCLNVGCIPSKMFIYAADLALQAGNTAKYGVDTSLDGVRWSDIRDRVFGRIDPIAAGGEQYRVGDETPNITVFKGHGRFVSERVGEQRVIEVNGEQLTAPTIVLAAGARGYVPPIPGIDPERDAPVVPYETSDTVMRLDELPGSMIVLGGGYIASELGHVFSAFGVDVTMVNRSNMLLRNEDDDIARRFTEVMSSRMDVRLGTRHHAVRQLDDGRIEMTFRSVDDDETQTVVADTLLVATGRVPNADQLEVAAAGIELDGHLVKVDGAGRTNVPGIWALGDLSNPHQLKHLANLEMRNVKHNILHPDDLRETEYDLTPHAVFGNPQIASVGLTERDARAQGLDVMVATKDYGATAYGWAMEDDTSFVKLVADRGTRKLLGAHLIGPQSSTLIQQLIQGMAFGQTVDEMAAGFMYIHPALTEVVENALLDFPGA